MSANSSHAADTSAASRWACAAVNAARSASAAWSSTPKSVEVSPGMRSTTVNTSVGAANPARLTTGAYRGR